MYKVIDIHVSQILNTDLDSLKAANLVLKMSEIKCENVLKTLSKSLQRLIEVMPDQHKDVRDKLRLLKFE